MYETGAIWSITAADGTTVTFNDGAGLILEEVTGFDSPDVRQNVSELPEQDFAIAGSFFYGSRPVTLSGKITNQASAAVRNVLVASMQQAARGLRSDTTVTSSPQGLPAMQATGRLQNLRITGGYVKDFQISLIFPDGRIYSQALHSASATGSVATTGAAFPLVFPIDFGGGSGATVSVTATNAGNFNSPPLLRVTGPITNPQVRNSSSGEDLYVDNLTLGASEYIDIDMLNRTVVKNDGTNLYSRVRFPASAWWLVAPGTNTIELRAGSTAGTATLTVSYRDVWV